jgi:hypothetical protein
MEISLENTTNLHLFNDKGAYKPEHDHAFTEISFGVGCCITAINIITFSLLLRHRKSVSEHGFWQQLLFLCFSDILSGIGLTIIPLFHLIDVLENIYYSFCIIGIVLFPLSVTLSAGNCFIISIQRYLVIRSIDTPITSEHRRVTYFMILGNVLLGLITISSSVLVVFAHFGFKYKEFCNNVNKTGQNEYKSIYIAGTGIILAIFLLGTNIFTVLSIVKIRRQGELQLCRILSPGPSTTVTTALEIMKRNRYATVTFIAIVFVMNITTVPSLMFGFVSMYNKLKIAAETTEIISRLMCINSFINPFIYSARTTDFRSAVWKDMKAIMSRIRCTSDTLQN